MGLIQENDVGKLMQDQQLMEAVVAGLVEDSGTMDTLADDIADKVQDALSDDPELRQKLISAAVSNDVFRRKLITKLISEIE